MQYVNAHRACVCAGGITGAEARAQHERIDQWLTRAVQAMVQERSSERRRSGTLFYFDAISKMCFQMKSTT
jgi:hypothetical protein